MEDIQIETSPSNQQGLPQDSQESLQSTGASSLPALVPSSSDLSAITMESVTTSPIPISRIRDRSTRPLRINSSEVLIAESSSEDVTSTDGSMVSIDNTGLNQSSKRTASGAIKSVNANIRKHTKEFSAAEVSNLCLHPGT
jgi:hypothetical protein